jgi:predicted permease
MLVFFSREPALAMMLSLYVTLGILLLLAARNPSANHSLIAFTAWSSFAHAGVMGLQVCRHIVGHVELPGVVVLLIIGIVLVALAPPRQSVERASTSKV